MAASWQDGLGHGNPVLKPKSSKVPKMQPRCLAVNREAAETASVRILFSGKSGKSNGFVDCGYTQDIPRLKPQAGSGNGLI